MASFTISTLSTTTQILDAGELGVITGTGVLTNAAAGVYLNGDFSALYNLGQIISGNGNGVAGLAANTRLTNSGTISSSNSGVFNASSDAGIFALNNSGLIEGTAGSAAGVRLSSGGARITNSGTIQSGQNIGIDISLGTTAEENRIVNSGVIIAGGNIAILTSSDADRVVNSGQIIGDLNLGAGVNVVVNGGSILGGVMTLGGADRIDSRLGTISGQIFTGAGADTVLGSAQQDEVLAGDGNDLLRGFAGDDSLRGNVGNDVVEGGAGDDTLSGDAGRDILLGGAGEDRLIGASGADTMTGGQGADVFVFTAVTDSAPSERDLITDFQRGADKIDLSAIDANLGMAGDQAFSFIGNGTAFTALGQARFVVAGGGVRLELNLNSSPTPEMVIVLNGLTALAAGDLIL